MRRGWLVFVVFLAAAWLAAQTANLQVTSAALGTGVQNRELTGAATTFPAGSQVYLWLRLTGGPSDPVTVTWFHNGNQFTYKLNVGGSPWRTWASKTVTAGDWTVAVTDAAGKTLKSLTFTVQ